MGEPAAKIKADDIAAVFREEIRADVESLKAKGIHPTLVGFLGTGDVSAKKYSEWTMKACEADGIRFEVREVSGACGPRAVPPPSGGAHQNAPHTLPMRSEATKRGAAPTPPAGYPLRRAHVPKCTTALLCRVCSTCAGRHHAPHRMPDCVPA